MLQSVSHWQKLRLWLLFRRLTRTAEGWFGPRHPSDTLWHWLSVKRLMIIYHWNYSLEVSLSFEDVFSSYCVMTISSRHLLCPKDERVRVCHHDRSLHTEVSQTSRSKAIDVIFVVAKVRRVRQMQRKKHFLFWKKYHLLTFVVAKVRQVGRHPSNPCRHQWDLLERIHSRCSGVHTSGLTEA